MYRKVSTEKTLANLRSSVLSLYGYKIRKFYTRTDHIVCPTTKETNKACRCMISFKLNGREGKTSLICSFSTSIQESLNFTDNETYSKYISINFKSVIWTRLVILAMIIANSLQQPLGRGSRKKLRKLQLLNVSSYGVRINCCFEAAILRLSARHKKIY